MDLIAKLPVIAATIYRNTYKGGKGIGSIDSNLDWSANYTKMLGFEDKAFTELMRLYLTIHRYYFITRQISQFRQTNSHIFSVCKSIAITKVATYQLTPLTWSVQH